MTGYRSRFFRWSCEDGRHCYYDSLPEWDDLIEALPPGIRPTDVDGMVERNGHFLFLEEKSQGVGLKEGQRKALRALCEFPRVTAVFFRPGVISDLECLVFSAHGPLLPGWEPYNNFKPHTRDEFLEWLREWGRVASATPLTCLDLPRSGHHDWGMATDVGTRIKRARERKRWTQRQLAKELGVNVKTVDNWENGRTSPRNSVGALEEVLGIGLDEEPEPEKPPAVRPEILREMYADIRAANSPEDAELMIANIEAALRGDPPPFMKRDGEERAAAG